MGFGVLIVEDDAEVADFLSWGLREEGIRALVASDGQAACEHLHNASWDVVVLDWGLPKMDGLTVLKRFRQHDRTTPVLFLTARDAVEDRVRGLNAGANDYLCKPFAFAELLARVKALSRQQKQQAGRWM